MLGCWLKSSMSDDVLKQASRFDTSREAWLMVENNFSSKSHARANQLKEDL